MDLFAASVIATVFFVASLGKMRQQPELIASIKASLSLDYASAVVLSRLLPAAELALVVALLVPQARSVALAGSIFMLAAFTLYLVSLVSNDAGPGTCACFGSATGSSPVTGIVRNLSLVALAVPALWSDTDGADPTLVVAGLLVGIGMTQVDRVTGSFSGTS